MCKRKNYSGAFKTKVALKALRSEKSLAKLSSRYCVHPNLTTKWKRHAIEGLEESFADRWSKTNASHDAEIKDIHAKIGQLTNVIPNMDLLIFRKRAAGVKKLVLLKRVRAIN